MDRKALKNHTHNRENVLTLDNPNYKQWVFRFTFLELEKDLGQFGDITTDTILEGGKRCIANIICKQDGILAGLNEIIYFLQDSDPRFKPSLKSYFELNTFLEDGAEIKKGQTILKLESTASSVLAVERIVLNLLGRMSGVATYTAEYVRAMEDFDVLLVPTRKTICGLLDKRAVTLGGGGTHRLDLSDSILIKDNHLKLMNYDFAKLFHLLHVKKPDVRFIEVEIENIDQALRVSKYFNEFSKAINSVPVVMFDNMSSECIKSCLDEIKSRFLYDGLLFEASGGVNLRNIRSYAETGVDIISVGDLTHSAPSLNFSMEIE